MKIKPKEVHRSARGRVEGRSWDLFFSSDTKLSDSASGRWRDLDFFSLGSSRVLATQGAENEEAAAPLC